MASWCVFIRRAKPFFVRLAIHAGGPINSNSGNLALLVIVVAGVDDFDGFVAAIHAGNLHLVVCRGSRCLLIGQEIMPQPVKERSWDIL